LSADYTGRSKRWANKSNVSPPTNDERVSPTDRDDELSRLGGMLNSLLGRLEEASDQQQLFAANASHELRSPLSAMRTDLEVGLAYPDRTDWERTAKDALIEIERLEQMTWCSSCAMKITLVSRSTRTVPCRS